MHPVWQNSGDAEVRSGNLGNYFSEEIPKGIEDLVQERQALRMNGKWEEADRIRREISKKGYEIRDTSAGPKLVRKGL